MATTHAYWYNSSGAVWEKTKKLWIWNGSWTPVLHLWIWDDANVMWRKSYTTTAGPLAYIEISPSTATVPSGTTQPFSVAGFDADDIPVALGSVSWTVSTDSDSIDTGSDTTTFYAGFATGDCTITAVSGGFSDTAIATVT